MSSDGHREDATARRDAPGSGSPLPDEARRANLALWNEWARIHEGTAFYDVAGFKAGRSSLWPLETEELGPYVNEGTSLLHLQCHFGLDTLSWARRGAEVVGVDFSGTAIALARRLADEVGLAGRATFIESDVYDAARHLGGRRFDIVFVSWGAIEWLPDLEAWARLCAGRTSSPAAASTWPSSIRSPTASTRRPGLRSCACATVTCPHRTTPWSTPSRARTPTRRPTPPGTSRTAGATASPRSSARCWRPGCVSSSSTRRPSRCRRCSSSWRRTRSAGGGCPTIAAAGAPTCPSATA
ncbi:MAG: class I SAM-dependent methyltransferase [Actinomycetota bacterium]|nr:MAG: class I SAM-dependent methyltransferase [Actinomycetota bacterium]